MFKWALFSDNVCHTFDLDFSFFTGRDTVRTVVCSSERQLGGLGLNPTGRAEQDMGFYGQSPGYLVCVCTSLHVCVRGSVVAIKALIRICAGVK